MLDSGAYSVWNSGATIDIDKYIAFCKAFPDTSYYISLDVMPGSPDNKKPLTTEEVERSCKQGWINYLKMIDHLPKEKVIPVYHQRDPIKWLDKYLNYGVPYMGISATKSLGMHRRIQWAGNTYRSKEDDRHSGFDVEEWKHPVLEKYLFDGAGRPVVKTHGFAITSFSMMNMWEWYSVDSSTWQMHAAMHSRIHVPKRVRGEYCYSKPPMVISTSPVSPMRSVWGYHLTSLNESTYNHVIEYLQELKVPLGKYKIVKVPSGYQIPRKSVNEFWLDAEKTKVVKVTEKGVITNLYYRHYVNARFLAEVNNRRTTKTKHIYFAGVILDISIEEVVPNRLISYEMLKPIEKGSKSSRVRKVFDYHYNKLRG